jgi:hypothetical protein
MNSMGEPDAGNLHVRFEEGPGQEIIPGQGYSIELCVKSWLGLLLEEANGPSEQH